MSYRSLATATLLFSIVLSEKQTIAQKSYPPEMKGAQESVYKEVGDVELKAYIFDAQGDFQSPRPAIVFFFGGGWRSGTPQQFEQHARYLAERGMVAICADYRVSSRHQVKALACIQDA